MGLLGQAWPSWFDPAQGVGPRGMQLERSRQKRKQPEPARSQIIPTSDRQPRIPVELGWGDNGLDGGFQAPSLLFVSTSVLPVQRDARQ